MAIFYHRIARAVYSGILDFTLFGIHWINLESRQSVSHNLLIPFIFLGICGAVGEVQDYFQYAAVPVMLAFNGHHPLHINLASVTLLPGIPVTVYRINIY